MIATTDTPTTVLATTDTGLQVLTQRQEVMFKDGSTVQLHPVQMTGVPHPFLRALQCSGDWVVTDLRKHGPELEDDVRRLQPRDTPGVVFFTLRATYRCRDDFVRAVMLNGTGGAAPGGAAPLPFPPPRHQAQSTAKDLFS
jgi:hypothetical protein